MFHTLDIILKSLLDDISMPTLVRDAEVAFDRPSDTYSPFKTTINLFLYDVRENTELRSNESVIERQKGMARVRKSPLRVNCSYLVTAWTEPGLVGEEAMLKQHELLGEVLRVFFRWPSIPLPTPDEKGKAFLQGELKQSLYPISLVTAQTDLMRSPGEFWSALGGKLRPSFTLTATIAIDQAVAPIEEHLVSTKQIKLSEKQAEKAEFEDSKQIESRFEIAGLITDGNTGAVLENVVLTLLETGQRILSDQNGCYRITSMAEGRYKLNLAKSGYATRDQVVVQVPGTSPTAFDFKLTPN